MLALRFENMEKAFKPELVFGTLGNGKGRRIADLIEPPSPKLKNVGNFL